MTPNPPAAVDQHTDEIVGPTPALPPVANRMFQGWDLKNKVMQPLMVNLLTAGVIGIWVWFFGANIRRWFFPPPRSADWPIYCVLEPVVNDSSMAQLEADLYVINLEATKHDERSLRDGARTTETDASLRLPTTITVETTGSSHRLLGIHPDVPFNEGKGRLLASNEGNLQRWTVTVEQIGTQAIMRARITTDVRRPITSKTDVETMPLKLLYARTYP